jgi:glycosyltransferase involved in cell wall biosynthesis
MPSTKCLIYERDVTGHRLHHVRHLTDALLEIGCDVTVALESNARTRPEYRVHLAPLESHFALSATLDTRQGNDYATNKRRVGELLHTIAEVDPDWVYVPFADAMTQAAAVRSVVRGGAEFRVPPIEGQVMRGRYAYPVHSLRQRAGAAASRWLMQRSPWRVTHILDTWVYNNLKGSAVSTEFRLIPEPVEPLPAIDRYEARRVLGIPEDGRYVATVGGMDVRKGIDLLLNAFVRAKVRDDDRLLLVGKMSQPMRDLVARDYAQLVACKRLVVVDRYVSDHELGCGFLAGDVLVTPHPKQVGSSGTMVRAAAANRPVIASDYGWVGWVTKEFGFGAAVNVTDADAFAAAIETSLDQPTRSEPTAAADRFRQYHTVQNQKAHWVATLGEERGIDLKGLGKRIDWQWVMEAAT